jgi:selenocysteine lyase/cysteine desulfurase
MKNYAKDFSSLDKWIWINASSTGVMPRIAVEAAQDIVSKYSNPCNLHEKIFFETPGHLKTALAHLIGAPADEIILGNSASYGLHLWANGLPLQKGDEVLLVKGDFPATILPWLALRNLGVIVREIKPKEVVLNIEDLKENKTDSTKVLCATWVDSFTGHAFDVNEIGKFCKNHNIWFLLNGTQAFGAKQFNVKKVPVDGITGCGYKWLCGPYGTGFCWLSPSILEKLEYNQAYWIPMQGDRELDLIRDYQVLTDLGAKQFDVFGTANLFNFIPWTRSVEYLNQQKISNIEQYNMRLVDQLLSEINQKYTVYSPTDPKERTSIIVFSHIDVKRNKDIFQNLKDSKIVCSLREGNIRLSPHLYNTPEDIERVVKILNQHA